MAVISFKRSLYTSNPDKYISFLAGNSAYIPTSFESIATATPNGVSSVTFSSIPSTYQHLQIRVMVRNDQASTGWVGLMVRPNNATGTYADHRLTGNGTTVSASNGTGRSFGLVDNVVPRNNNTSNIFGVSIIDVIDYASSTKNKTFRAISGLDLNGSGTINLTSFLWVDTTAITSLVILPETGNFLAGTTISLYGIKG